MCVGMFVCVRESSSIYYFFFCLHFFSKKNGLDGEMFCEAPQPPCTALSNSAESNRLFGGSEVNSPDLLLSLIYPSPLSLMLHISAVSQLWPLPSPPRPHPPPF